MNSGEQYRIHAVGCTCGWAVCRCPVEHIVFYAGGNSNQWIVERTADRKEVARGSLEEMMALVDGPSQRFKGRRAHWAEDATRNPPSIFYMDYEFGKKP